MSACFRAGVSPLVTMSIPSFRRTALAATAFLVANIGHAEQADFNVVGKQVGIMLQNAHFARLPFSAETSQRFLDDYLKDLDPGRVYFTQADVDRFKKQYGGELFKMLIQGRCLDAANDINGTYRKRVEARGEMARKFFKEDAFDYSTAETTTRTRKDAAWPKDDAEADRLLRVQLKEAVLSETLLRELQVKMAKDQGKPDPTKSEAPPREKISMRYERFLNTVKSTTTEDIADGLIGSVARSYDPHTDYMIDREATRFNDAMRNELVGIGAELKPEDDGTTRIMGIMIGGPAEKEGTIQLNDRIVAVDTDNSGSMTDVLFMDKDKVVDLIRGKEGSTVRLKVQPATAAPGETRIATIPRGKVEIKGSQASAGIIQTTSSEGASQRMGWITLPSFYVDFTGQKAGCAADVERLLKRLTEEKIDGLIFDIRSNGGGSLEEVRRMTGFFTGAGPVVQEKNTLGQVKSTDADNQKAIYTGPLVVLTNKASASASEILAGALQDYHRAVIVGDSSTFGKGTVQEPLNVARMLPFFAAREGAGTLKLTIRKFYRPSGSSTQLDGVASDIVLPGVTDAMEFGERFLDHAFPHDRIQPASGFNPMNADDLFVPRLKELSQARVKADKDFTYFTEDAARAKDEREKNSVSLNMEDRRKELFTLSDRQDKRNAERRERFKAIEEQDAKALKLTKLTLDDLTNHVGFHPFDPKKENEEYIRRVKDPIEELNDTPDWPSGLDPVKREGLQVLKDLIDTAASARLAAGAPPKKEAEIR